MSLSYLLPCGADLIEFTAGLVEGAGSRPESCLVVFPNRRPREVLARRLAEGRGAGLMAPAMFSVDDFVERQALALGLRGRRLEAADGAALLYRMHPDRQLPGEGQSLPLEDFLAWGFSLFEDFEELLIEGIDPGDLASVESLARDPLPERFGRQLAGLGGWYGHFYRQLEEDGFYTRAMAYRHLARRAGQMDLSGYSLVVLSGFFALTGAEREMFSSLLERDNVALVLRDGPGIERIIAALDISPRKAGAAPPEPAISYLTAGDSHGLVMALGDELGPGDDLGRTVLTLCRPDTVYPVLNHLLPGLEGQWNISMGYPLSRTPLYDLLEAIAQAQESREGDNYFLPHYLRLMMHPYVKNLSLDGAGYPTRAMFHGLEELLSRGARRLIAPRLLEHDEALWGQLGKRLAGLPGGDFGPDRMRAHLAWIHNLVLYPFEQFGTVASFCQKLRAVLDEAAGRSRAGLHPYAGEFFQMMAEALAGLEHSLLGVEKFREIRPYFSLARHFVSQAKVPFPGTSRRGLQVLGFLETRGLSFQKVVMLDLNEGQLPSAQRIDTLLPQALRSQLGLPTAAGREAIDRYHFENLVRGARQAVLGYTEGEGGLPSRFVEQLVWQEEQRSGRRIRGAGHRLVHFDASFSQESPAPVAKNPRMMEAISRLRFSPSMLDSYLKCGLRFFYRYLAGIRERDQVSLDVERSEVGTLVHGALEAFFKGKENVPYQPGPQHCQAVEQAVEQAFVGRYGRDQDGTIYLIKRQVKARLKSLISLYGQEDGGFTVLKCECELKASPELPGLGPVPMFGRADRIDLRGDEVVILDYKTGRGEIPSYEKFMAEGRDRWPHWLRSTQLPMYIMLYLAENPGLEVSRVNSELFLLGGERFEAKPLFDGQAIREEVFGNYRQAVATLVREIRDQGIPFGETGEPIKECSNCPYKNICGRQWIRENRW